MRQIETAVSEMGPEILLCRAESQITALVAALKEIREAAKQGDGTSTECHMAYLADEALQAQKSDG